MSLSSASSPRYERKVNSRSTVSTGLELFTRDENPQCKKCGYIFNSRSGTTALSKSLAENKNKSSAMDVIDTEYSQLDTRNISKFTHEKKKMWEYFSRYENPVKHEQKKGGLNYSRAPVASLPNHTKDNNTNTNKNNIDVFYSESTEANGNQSEPKLSDEKKRAIDQLYMRWVESSCQALFSISENKEFLNFLKMLCPYKYAPPSGQAISTMILADFDEKKKIVRKRFAELQPFIRLSLTVDSWSCDSSLNSYLGVSTHFVDNDGQSRSLLIGCLPYEKPQNAIYMSSTMISVILFFVQFIDKTHFLRNKDFNKFPDKFAIL